MTRFQVHDQGLDRQAQEATTFFAIGRCQDYVADSVADGSHTLGSGTALHCSQG